MARKYDWEAFEYGAADALWEDTYYQYAGMAMEVDPDLSIDRVPYGIPIPASAHKDAEAFTKRFRRRATKRQLNEIDEVWDEQEAGYNIMLWALGHDTLIGRVSEKNIPDWEASAKLNDDAATAVDEAVEIIGPR